MMKKLVNWICYFSMFLALVILIGTAGASDVETITIGTIVVRGLIAVALFGVAYLGLFINSLKGANK